MSKLVYCFLVLVAVLSRFMPHPANVTPVVALALFAGAFTGQNRWAPLLPICVMLISDWFLGVYPGIEFVYAAFLLIALMGLNLKQNRSALRLSSTSLAASLVFYLVSNFGVWFSAGLYSKDFAGLIQCYVMAIPFFRHAVIGDLFFTAFLFTAYKFFQLAVKGSDKAKLSLS